MAEIINLRRVRRQQQRADADQAAAVNRARFGRTRAERDMEAAQVALSGRVLDGARLDPQAEEEPAANGANERQTTS